jgi:hypothetical protein
VHTVVTFVAVIAMFTASGGELKSFIEAMLQLRTSAGAAAGPAFHAWIESVPDDALATFGFSPPQEAKSATLVPGIPYFTPLEDAQSLVATSKC